MREIKEEDQTDYMKYRGKCREFCLKLVKEDPSLTMVRGHYWDAFWGEQPHWWCVKPDGTIVDPTAKQFPTKGDGEYVPFSGIISCEECGKEVKEENAIFHGRYGFCSGRCACACVGVEYNGK